MAKNNRKLLEKYKGSQQTCPAAYYALRLADPDQQRRIDYQATLLVSRVPYLDHAGALEVLYKTGHFLDQAIKREEKRRKSGKRTSRTYKDALKRAIYRV